MLVTDEQYARIGARLINAVQIWAEDAGIARPSLAILLASAAGELAAQDGGGLPAGAALLRSVANTLEGFAHGATAQEAARPPEYRKIRARR